MKCPAIVSILMMIGFYGVSLGIAGVLLVPIYLVFSDPGLIHASFAGFCCALAFSLVLALVEFLRFKLPGVPMNRISQPEIFERVARVAGSLKQEMPETVYLTSDADTWMARRGAAFGMGGQRVMGVGLPLLQTLTISQFDALTADTFAFARFQNGMYGRWVYRTRRAINRTAMFFPLVEQTVGRIVAGYGRLFLKVARVVHVTNILAADRHAAASLGSDTVIELLRIAARVSPIAAEYFVYDIQTAAKAGFLLPVIQGFSAKLATPASIRSMNDHLQSELTVGDTDPDSLLPTLPQRIAAVESLPLCANRDDRPALSLLRDLESLEYRLVASLVPEGKYLKPLDWTDAGEAIWMTYWQDLVDRYAEQLERISLSDLFKIASRLEDYGRSLLLSNSPSLLRLPDPETCRFCEREVLGAAIACRLYGSGWTPLSGPGVRGFRRGSVEFDPFATIDEIASGKLKEDDWKARMDALSLFPSMPLCQLTKP